MNKSFFTQFKTAKAIAFSQPISKFDVIINGRSLLVNDNHFFKQSIMSVFDLIPAKCQSIVYRIVCLGGGIVSSSNAIRSSILKVAINYFKLNSEESSIKSSLRYILVSNTRKKYPKRQLGRGARSRHQLSFR